MKSFNKILCDISEKTWESGKSIEYVSVPKWMMKELDLRHGYSLDLGFDLVTIKEGKNFFIKFYEDIV